MSEYQPNPWFGRKYDAPAWDWAPEAPTPVGEVCIWCDEPIAADDAGWIQTVVEEGGHARIGAVHVECHIRAALGSIAHNEGRCSCHGGTEDATPMSWREEGKELMRRFNMKPL